MVSNAGKFQEISTHPGWTFDGERAAPCVRDGRDAPRRGAGANEGLKPRMSMCVIRGAARRGAPPCAAFSRLRRCPPPPTHAARGGRLGERLRPAVAACLLVPACLRRRVCPLSLHDLPALLCLEPRVHVLRRVRVGLAWGGLRAFHSAGGTTHTRKCTGQTAQLMAARTLE